MTTLTETRSDLIRPDAPLAGSVDRNAAAAAPVRLLVPRIGIDTGLVRLGLLADGQLAVPVSAAIAGWYTDGPAPGQVGPAVLAGHVDSYTGPGVFYRLRDLRTGDRVQVRRADGRQVQFAVTGVERFAKSSFPTARVYGPTPFTELRLVTCGGSFDAARGHYRDNVVVFARQLG
jgi:Sortase domain